MVEVEDEHGKSIKVGKWIDRKDGTWALEVDLSSLTEFKNNKAVSERDPMCMCGIDLYCPKHGWYNQ